MLEQILSLQKTNPSEQKNYDSRALDYLGALKLYTGTIGPMFNYGPLAPMNNLGSAPKTLSSAPLRLEATGGSYKIFSPEIKAPLTRLDLDNHEYGSKHLQHGKKDFFGRTGNEAADIFAQIYTQNIKIKFPWEK